MKEALQKFFDQAGINKSGFCKEAGISYFWLLQILNGKAQLSPEIEAKILAALTNYNNLITKILNYDENINNKGREEADGQPELD